MPLGLIVRQTLGTPAHIALFLRTQDVLNGFLYSHLLLRKSEINLHIRHYVDMRIHHREKRSKVDFYYVLELLLLIYFMFSNPQHPFKPDCYDIKQSNNNKIIVNCFITYLNHKCFFSYFCASRHRANKFVIISKL